MPTNIAQNVFGHSSWLSYKCSDEEDTFIRLLLEYCDAVWNNCSAENKKQLESIHVEAARIISGATRLSSIEKLFSDLDWESLQSRRNKHKLIIFCKIIN